jgi:hypothetical protein
MGRKVLPQSSKSEKRRADVISNSVMIAKIATGEIEDVTTEDRKNAAAVALGAWAARRGRQGVGGEQMAKKRQIAKSAAATRWKK